MADSEVTTAAPVEQRLAALESRVSDLEDENERLQERVDELEEEQESRAAVRWDGNKPGDIAIEADYEFPLGETLVGKAGRSEVESLEEDIERLLDDVHDLKLEGVDAADLVGAGTDEEPELPIEDAVAALRSDVRDDPSANKQRATVLFRAFGGRAHKTKGGKLKLHSADARSILKEKAGMEDVNRNTLKRSMRQTAKLTSKKEEGNRQARDEENIITLTKDGEGRLTLRADAEEWRSYLSEVNERYR